MAAPKKNDFWRKRTKHGRDKIFKTPNDLMEAALEYFDEVESNPLWEPKLATEAGLSIVQYLERVRPFTLDGLMIFLDITDATWYEYAGREDYSSVSKQIMKVIRTQKLEGAAAGFFNANIIARDLGLKDASTTELSGPNGGPIVTDIQVEFIIPDGK